MWVVVADHQNYAVSETGLVKNIKTNRILKPCATYNGYLRVNLNRKCYRIHILVAEAFIGKVENGAQINHKDGNKKNNHVSNLEWCSAKENIRHAYETGLHKVNYDNIKQPKPVVQTDLDGKVIRTFDSIISVERELGYNNSNISKVCRNVQTTAYGYKWHYAI